MELQTLDLSQVYFPRDEWRWLRAPARYPTSLKDAPDAFLWAARVNGKLWAWHPNGADLETGFDGMKTRVLILETDGSEIAAHGLYLKTTFAKGGAQDVEWVAALQVLTDRLQFLPSDKGIPPYWKEALEVCGLEPNLGILAQRGKFVFLTKPEEQLIYDKRWDLATLELLETVQVELREKFVETIRKWNLTAGQTKEVLSLLTLLVKKMGEKTAQNILTSPFKSAEEFRMTILRTSQPEFAALTQKRIESLRGLQVPARTSVFGDPNFEKDVLKITHTPRNMVDFESFKTWIEDPATFEKVRALLEIYQ